MDGRIFPGGWISAESLPHQAGRGALSDARTRTLTGCADRICAAFGKPPAWMAGRVMVGVVAVAVAGVGLDGGFSRNREVSRPRAHQTLDGMVP